MCIINLLNEAIFFASFDFREFKEMLCMKIKSFILFLTCILAIVMSFFSYEYQNLSYYYKYFSYNDYITLLEEKEVVPLWIELNDPSQDSISDLLTQLTVFSSENNVDYAIVTNVRKDISTSVNKYYLYINNQAVYDDFKERGAMGIDFASIQSQGYYTTDINDKEATGKVRILDNYIFNQYATHSQFLPVLQSINEIENQKGFYVYFYSNHAQLFSEKIESWLQEKYSNSLHYINDKDIYHAAELENFSQESINKLRSLLISIGFIYGTYLIVYFMKKKRHIMIQKIYGISVNKIVFKDLIYLFLCIFLIFNIILYGSNYMISHQQTFTDNTLFHMLIQMSVMMFIILCIISIMIYVFVRSLTSLKHLSNGHSNQKSIFMTLTLKIVILIFMTIPFITSFTSFVTSLKQGYFLNKNYDLISQNYYIDGSFKNSENDEKVMNYYFQNDGLFCDFMTGYGQRYEVLKEQFPDVDQEDLKDSSINFPLIYVSQNYLLQQNNIYDTQHNEIDLKQYSSDILLVPSQYIKEDLEKAYLGYEVPIIEIENTGSFINFYDIEPRIIQNPVIYLCNQYNSRLQMDMLFIPKHNSLQDISKNINELTGETPIMIDYEKRVDSNIINIKKQIFEFGTMAILYIVLFVGIIYQTTFLFIEQYKKILSILYVFGKNKYERYLTLIIINLAVYIVPIIIQILINKISILSFIYFYSVCFIFECVCMFVFIRHLEKHSINIILKGEEKL